MEKEGKAGHVCGAEKEGEMGGRRRGEGEGEGPWVFQRWWLP